MIANGFTRRWTWSTCCIFVYHTTNAAHIWYTIQNVHTHAHTHTHTHTLRTAGIVTEPFQTVAEDVLFGQWDQRAVWFPPQLFKLILEISSCSKWSGTGRDDVLYDYVMVSTPACVALLSHPHWRRRWSRPYYGGYKLGLLNIIYNIYRKELARQTPKTEKKE